MAKLLDGMMNAVSSRASKSSGRVPRRSGADAAALATTLRLSITRLARRMRQLADTDLTPSQLSALAMIERSESLSLSALAEQEQIGAPTMSKIVDKLHDAGLVERRNDNADRRVTRLSVTPAGHDTLNEIRQRRTAWLATRLAELDDDDLAALSRAAEVLHRLTIAPTTPSASPPSTAPPSTMP
ncbi:MAG: MarR family transcriptional regulator [Acidimicrobiales bacterium]|nr:MarR family transcriptional regulator [Acidimicrobiales bacterium]